MSEKRRGFVAFVLKSGKITIPYMTRKLLGIKKGDMVDKSDIRNLGPEKEDSLTKNSV